MDNFMQYLAELVLSQLEKRKPAPLPDNIDITDIIRAAGRGHMSTILLGALLKTDISEELRKDIWSALIPLVAVNHTQIREFGRLIERFEEEHIVSQPMKGILLKNIYPQPEFREMGDIDILVNSDELDRVKGILCELGYVFASKEAHHDIYTKGNSLALEIHWTLYDSDIDANQHNYFTNFSRTEPLKDYKYTYTFNENDFYVYMISHAAKHFYARGCGIRNLVDIYVYREYYKDRLDWEYIRRELAVCGIDRFAVHMEKLAYLWLEKKECSEFYRNLFDYMLDCGIYGRDGNGIWNRYAHTGFDKRSKLGMRMWYYFPPYNYMKDLYPWLEKKAVLLPAAWIMRGIRGIFKAKGLGRKKMLESTDTETAIKLQDIYQQMSLDFKKQ